MNTPAATKKKIAIMVNESSAAKEVGAMVETLRNSELYRAAMAEKARATAMGTPSSRQRNMVPASAAMMPISHCPHMGAESVTPMATAMRLSLKPVMRTCRIRF